MTRPPKDIAASVRARLLQLARDRGDDYQLVLVRYVNERLLYRLAASVHASSFVLKGATLFAAWTNAPYRATRDIDLLGFVEPSQEYIRSVFIDVLGVPVEADGVRFDASALDIVPIRGAQEYGGMRVLLAAKVDGARVRVQVDIGFGDAVTPDAVMVDFPTLLAPFPAPRLRVYPPETVVAEKLEAMVQLGQLNTRMKDFHDLMVLSQVFAFEGTLLVRAVIATFERRGTPLPAGLPIALTPRFAEDGEKQKQWAAFRRKSGVMTYASIGEVTATVARFAEGPLAAAGLGAVFARRWPSGGPWS